MNISSLFGVKPISFYPQLRQITGSIPAAIMLQQLLYWWDRRKGETVHKTEAEMQEETSLTRHEQKSAIKTLTEKGFITVKRKGVPPKRHFIVHEDAINNALNALIKEPESGALKSRNPADQRAEIRLNNTENTTETTAENTAVSIPTHHPAADCVSEKSDAARIAEETDLESLHRRLMKVSGQENNPSIGLQSLHEIVSLLSEGLSIEEDIIPAAEEIAKRGKRITSWKYLAAIARDIHAKRESERKKTRLGNIIEDWEWPYIARIAHAEKRWYWDAWGAPPSLPTTLIPEKYHHLFDGVEEYAISHINPIKERTKERYEWYLRTWEELNGDSNS